MKNLNRFLLQWFFIRLSKHVEKGILKHWLLTAFVLPLTGTAEPYQSIGKVRVYSLDDRKVRRRLLNDPLWVVYPLIVLRALMEKFELWPELSGIVSGVLYFSCGFLFVTLVMFSITERQVGKVDGLPRKLKWRTDGSKPPRSAEDGNSEIVIISKGGVYGRAAYNHTDRTWDCLMLRTDGDHVEYFSEIDAWTYFE